MVRLQWLGRGKRPVLLKLRSSPVLIITTCSFAVFTDVFLYSVIVPVSPFALESRIGIAPHRIQYWVSISLAVYGAALLASSPLWGYLADRIQNRRLPMLIGLILLAAATSLLCASTTLAMFLVGRVLQGLAAALTWTVGLALVADSVDQNDVGRSMGFVGMAASLGILVGPLLGGLAYGKGGYYPVFAMCFGLLAVDIFLRLVIIEVKDAKPWLDMKPPTPMGDPEVAPDNAKGEASGAVPDTPGMAGHEEQDLERVQQQQEGTRVVRTTVIRTLWTLLSNARLLAAFWGTFVQAVISTAFESVLPLQVANLFGWDSIGAGLIFLPVILPAFLSPLIGMLCDRYGSKWITTIGFCMATPFLVCLRFVDENTMGHKVMLCGLLFGIGLGVTFIFGPLMAEITWSISGGGDLDPAEVPYAQAYGLYNMAYSGGTLIGPIMGGLIRESAGWSTLGWSLAIVTLVSAVPSFLWIGGPVNFRFSRTSSTS